MDFAHTIAEELCRTAARHPDVPAFHFHGADVTYAQWDRYATRFARALLAAGLRKGDRLGLLLPPIPEYLMCYLGAARVGVLTAGISTRYRRHELREILANADPTMIITVGAATDVDLPALIEEARSGAPSLRAIVRFEGEGRGTLDGLMAAGDAADVDLGAAEAMVGAGDPIAIIYTSGTTGTPKGAVYDSAAMIALTTLFRSRLPTLPAPGEPQLWPGMSLTHVGAMVRIHIQIASAGTLVVHESFDASWCIAQLLRLRPARLGGFPPVLMMLMRSPEIARHDFSFIKSVTFGGAPLAAHLVEEIRDKLGVDVFTGYSCTETAIISATLPTDPPARREGTVGKPTPGITVHIVDEQRQPLPSQAPGRIAVRSPATMRGYWRRPEETEQALDADGWLYTEDYGFLDAHGYLHLIGREKDMYYRAAFNVYPGEIEGVLQHHPKVAQAAVIGVPDDVLGQKGWAFVVPTQPDDPPTLDELRQHVGREMASYKRPDGMTVVSSLPTNIMYKVDKRELRASYDAAQGRAG